MGAELNVYVNCCFGYWSFKLCHVYYTLKTYFFLVLGEAVSIRSSSCRLLTVLLLLTFPNSQIRLFKPTNTEYTWHDRASCTSMPCGCPDLRSWHPSELTFTTVHSNYGFFPGIRQSERFCRAYNAIQNSV